MNRNIRKMGLAVLRYFPATRRTVRKAYYAQQGATYAKLAKDTPTEDRTVFFESYGGRQYACSPRAIFEQMCADPRFSDFTFIWSFQVDHYEQNAHMPAMQRCQTVIRGSNEYWTACARAKYWIVNTRMPEYFTPKDDQVYVQCWHGTPLKRLGFDVPKLDGALNTADELSERFLTDSGKWSHLVSPSDYTSQHLCDAFGVPDSARQRIVLQLGYPRNDRIVNESHDARQVAALRSKICAKLGVDPTKKLLLYAPTWRDDLYKAGEGYVLDDTLLDFAAMRDALADEWCVLFRAHYYIANSLDFAPYAGFVGDASQNIDINDLYILSDVLLTDYSSVFFDFANTGRPMMFYWPDYDHYANDLHGFYFSLKELPGPQCETTAQVIEALERIDSYTADYSVVYDAFLQRFCPLDDGQASQRVIDAIFKQR